jgi:hypothetical protein
VFRRRKSPHPLFAAILLLLLYQFAPQYHDMITCDARHSPFKPAVSSQEGSPDRQRAMNEDQAIETSLTTSSSIDRLIDDLQPSAAIIALRRIAEAVFLLIAVPAVTFAI